MGSTKKAPKGQSQREWDVVLWGATGYTGRVVAEYLVRNYSDDDLRWALAGRNRSKLEGVRRDLAAIDPRAADLPIVTGDSGDRASLDDFVGRSRVVCTTVGPYARYGTELVASCAANGTDYCDITGEVQWIRRMVDAYHDQARESGARIVPCCGFDSIPSDLGCLMMQEAMRARHGVPCQQVKYFVARTKGGFSGGTAASLVNVAEEMRRDPGIRRIMADPYSLNPAGERHGPDGRDQVGVRRDDDTGGWTGPFIMAAINTRIVRRSNALMGYAYGRDFRYSEAMSLGKGAKGLFRASSLTAGMAGFMGAMQIGPARGLIQRFILPKSGEGPTPAERDAGFFEVHLFGHAGGHTLRGRVAGTSDPGYGETSKMLAESAVCLAQDDLPEEGGLLTTASCMGMTLVARLRAADMTFEVS